MRMASLSALQSELPSTLRGRRVLALFFFLFVFFLQVGDERKCSAKNGLFQLRKLVATVNQGWAKSWYLFFIWPIEDLHQQESSNGFSLLKIG